MTDPFLLEVATLPGQFLWEPEATGSLGNGRVVLAGMGGSALAAEMAGSWVGEEMPWRMVRGPKLPPWTSPEEGVLCVSFSGNTRETLGVWEEAGARGLARAAVASGGKLLESARQNGDPYVEIPSGLSPRSSLGYLLKGCLSLLAPSRKPNWPQVSSHLETLKATLEAGGAKEDLVLRAEGGLIVVSSPVTALAARRWAADFSENAKLPLWIWEFPEATHNALMVLASESKYPRPTLYILESSVDESAVEWQEFLSLLGETGARVLPVRFPHEDTWIELLGLAYAGDWQSVRYAQALGVPAGSLSLLNAFKARLDRRLKS